MYKNKPTPYDIVFSVKNVKPWIFTQKYYFSNSRSDNMREGKRQMLNKNFTSYLKGVVLGILVDIA